MATLKHVFITGASSELMQKVVDEIDRTRFTIACLSRDQNRVSGAGIKWVFGDINQPENYSEEVEKADIILHAAAITHSKRQQPYYEVNVNGTKALIGAIPKGKTPLFVFISSRVAGERSGAYGVSKLRAEEEVRKLERWLIIRPSEVFGGSKSEGIEKTIHSAIRGGLQLCPTGVDSKMFPIHLTDTARAIFETTFKDEVENQTIILNGREGYSFKELLRLVESISGNEITIIPIPKLALNLVGIMASILPLEIGFVPDQVPRLYSKKPHGKGTEGILTIEEYVKSLMKQRND